MPNTVTSRPLRMGASIPHAMVLAVLAALVADLTLRFSPTGFAGGGTDDQRYLEAALAWYRDGIEPGKTHWALRHPLILAVLASFKMFGPTTDAMLLVPRLAWALLVAVTTGGLARFAGLRAAAFGFEDFLAAIVTFCLLGGAREASGWPRARRESGRPSSTCSACDGAARP